MDVEGILVHYGVRGMRWGVRRSRAELRSSPISDDARMAKTVKSKVQKRRRGGTDALSNKELQALVTRMNLEQQYSRLSQEPSRVKTGKKVAKDILDTGATINTAITFANSPAGQLLKQSLKK